ncbi:MAG TPA: LuxR C-terminal-related transcriptional regulator [Ensifer sp.]|nr:LuxR C-terminal-related transcriptional regulator [Ensifer sp.]
MPGPTGYHALLDALRDGAAADPQSFLVALREAYHLAHVLYGDLRREGETLLPGTLLHGRDPDLDRLIREEGIEIFNPLLQAAARRFGPGLLDPAELENKGAGGVRARRVCGSGPLLLFPLLPSRPGIAFFVCAPGNASEAGMSHDILLRDLAALAGLFHARHVSRPRNIPPDRDRKQAQPRLTPRERQVLHWVAAGKTYWEIARILGISERTVRHFMAACREKLDAASNKQAVAKAVAGGLIAVGDARAVTPASDEYPLMVQPNRIY